MKWALSPSFGDTFGNFWPLSLTSSAYVKSSCLLTISTNPRYRKCLYTYSRHISGVLSVTFDHCRWLFRLASVFIVTYTITWNARYRQLANIIMLMNTLAILRGNFGPLSLTTSTYVNLHRDLYHYLERALSPTCEHFNVNVHPSQSFGVLSVTFNHYHWLHRLASIFKDTYHYFESALSPTFEHYNVSEHPRNPSGYFR